MSARRNIEFQAVDVLKTFSGLELPGSCSLIVRLIPPEIKKVKISEDRKNRQQKINSNDAVF